jgi:hypothetical protein
MESVGSGELSTCVLGAFVTISSTATAVSVLGSMLFVSSAVCRGLAYVPGILCKSKCWA